MSSSSSTFRVALFSDPPSVFPIIMRFLQAKLDLACVVSFFPRGNFLKTPDFVKKELDLRKIPFILPETLKSPETQKAILETRPTVIATMSLIEKIPWALLEKVPLGGVNWHPALLPQYRGPLPCYWPIVHQEKETGITIHKMTEEFDSGDIYFQRKIKIEPDETHGSLWLKTEEEGIKLMILALQEMQKGKKLPLIPQNHSKASFAPMPTSKDLQIDWNKPAVEILALVRAASPIFGAIFQYKNHLIKLWSARLTRPNDRALPPGTVVTSTGLLEVAAADFLISLETLQIGLLRFASGQEFLSISGIREGDNLCKTP